jgi:hypothetical protein
LNDTDEQLNIITEIIIGFGKTVSALEWFGRTVINCLFQVLYIVKPIAHLCSMMLFGQKNWKPWLLSLSVDLTR